ncbi:MAG TPA: 4-hydroxy-tetrahydrodipicolinate reductase [Desulfomonilaceae bacterium]|nr:4-hydroxy-tetrahydrodipicolinate reductase [Desulfomonilaceae bacterium]
MKIAVSGAAGRMGQRILTLSSGRSDIQISGALEAPNHPALGKDAGELAGIGHIGVPITSDREGTLRDCDLLIDFSAPTASVENVKKAAAQGKAIVVGTTGFSEEQRTSLMEAGSATRCLVAPNMSLGVNLLFRLVEIVARSLGPEYDVEIVESHHKMKKDAPSGTADKLAGVIAQALDRDLATAAVYGRHGLVGERQPQEIGVMAVRGGDIVGEHTVMFITEGERIELIHRAQSRDAFAKGAIQAALWLISKPTGLYDMQDVLGLKGS